MTSPTLLYVLGLAVLSSDNVRVCTAFTVSLSGLELMPLACAVAVFVTEPAFRRSGERRVGEEHVTDGPAASPPAGQVTVALLSVTVTGPASVTFPVLVTR